MSYEPVYQFDPALLLRAQGLDGSGIKAVILDVDGVLTDGTLFFTDEGETLKGFNVLDGQGLAYLKKMGVTTIIITGRDSAPLRTRLSGLGIEHAYFGIKNKLAAAEEVLGRLQLGWDQLAVMGDDWPDLALFKRAAFAVAPKNAHPENLAKAHYITQAQGGAGAVRELCDLLLMASGQYAQLYREIVV